MLRPDLKTIKYRDEEWAMVHDGWPTGKPGVDAGADRHELLHYVTWLESALFAHHYDKAESQECPLCNVAH
jgi:hypothetical protein